MHRKYIWTSVGGCDVKCYWKFQRRERSLVGILRMLGKMLTGRFWAQNKRNSSKIDGPHGRRRWLSILSSIPSKRYVARPIPAKSALKISVSPLLPHDNALPRFSCHRTTSTRRVLPWNRKVERKTKNKRGCNTRTSQEVTHLSTALAQARLTAEFWWDPVH